MLEYNENIIEKMGILEKCLEENNIGFIMSYVDIDEYGEGWKILIPDDDEREV